MQLCILHLLACLRIYKLHRPTPTQECLNMRDACVADTTVHSVKPWTGRQGPLLVLEWLPASA